MRILSKQQIARSLPSLVIEEGDEWPNPRKFLGIAKALYGRDNVRYLTHATARALYGKSVWALVGQNWDAPRTQAQKLANLEKITIQGFYGNEAEPSSSSEDINISLGSRGGYEFVEAYKSTDGAGQTYFATGTGADPVILLVREGARKAGSPKKRSPSPKRRGPSPKGSPKRSPPRAAGAGSPGACKNMSNLKKYRERPGPPYPAQDCKGQFKMGNDGRLYESRANKNGVYAWKLDSE